MYRAEFFMNTLLLVMFGIFGMHNILWLIRELEGSGTRKPRSPHGVARRYVQRFTPWQRFLHILMVTTLPAARAMTGLPLKFSPQRRRLLDRRSTWRACHVAAIAHRVGARS